MPPTPLRVIPNPFSALDQFGFPSGAARLDPDKQISAGQRRYIGARLSAEILVSRDAGLVGAGLAPTLQRNVWVFQTDKAIEIPDTAFHRALLQARDILPWDVGTHVRVFPSSVPFVEPVAALAVARDRAIERWRAQHPRGEDPAFLAEARGGAAAKSPASPGAGPKTHTGASTP